MGLASHVSHVGLGHEMIERRTAQGIGGQHHRHVDGEHAVVAGRGSTLANHLVLAAQSAISSLPVAAVRQPPPCHAPLDSIVDAGTLYGNTGIAHGTPRGAHGVALLVGLLIFVELHLEGGAFVFFYADGGRTTGDTHGETAVQLSGGQDERRGALAIAVGSHLLPGHLLVVGITQLNGDLLVGNGLLCRSRHFAPHNGRHVDGLAGPVDGTVGKHIGALAAVAGLIVAVAAVGILPRTVFVGGRHGINSGGLTVFLVMQHLALTVAGQRLPLLRLVPAAAVRQQQPGTGNGLSRGGIYYHIAHHTVGLGLHQQSYTGHEIELAHHTRGRLRLELQQIDSGRQGTQHEGVAEHLIVRTLAERQRALHACQHLHARLYLTIVFQVVGVKTGVSLQTGTVDIHRQLADVAQTRQLHRLCLVYLGHALRNLCIELRIGQLGHPVVQFTHAPPARPPLQCRL